MALICLVFFFPVLFGGKVFLPADLLARMQPWRSMGAQLPLPQQVYNPMLDPIQQYYPWRKFGAEWLKQGILPLWNPRMFAGVPFLANGQSALLYPLNWLFWLFPVEKAFGYAAFLHVYLCGLFTFLFLRDYRLSHIVAAFGAIAFMLSGFFIAWMQFPTFASVGIWLPLLLLLIRRAIRGQSLAWAALAGLVLGLQFLAGHLQISVYLLLTFGAFALFTTFTRENRSRWSRSLGLICVSLVLGALVGAAQLLPTMEYSQYNFPKGGSYQGMLRGGYNSFEGFLFLIPNIFGNPVRISQALGAAQPGVLLNEVAQRSWGVHNFCEGCNYVGVGTILLILLALVLCRKPVALFFAGLACFSLLVAFGSPLNWLFFHLVPGFKQITGITRIVYLWCFAASILAAFGFEEVRRKNNRSPRLIAILCLGFFVAAALVALYAQTFISSAFGGADFGHIARAIIQYARNSALRFLGFSVFSIFLVMLISRVGRRWTGYLSACLVGLLLIDLFSFGRPFNPMVSPTLLRITPTSVQLCREKLVTYRMVSPGSNFLDRLPPNLPSVYGLSDIQGSDSFCPKTYWDFLARLQEGNEFGLSKGLRSPLFDILAVKYILTSQSLSDKKFKLVASPEANLYENKEAFPRARFLSEAIVCPNFDQAREEIWKGEVDLSRQLVLCGVSEPHRVASGIAQPGSAEILPEKSPNQVKLITSSLTPGWLVLSDNFFPGWQAYVGGKSQRILRANYCFRAVELAPGEHKVEFIYRPASFMAGFFALSCGIMLLSAIFLGSFIRARFSKRRGNG